MASPALAMPGAENPTPWGSSNQFFTNMPSVTPPGSNNQPGGPEAGWSFSPIPTAPQAPQAPQLMQAMSAPTGGIGTPGGPPVGTAPTPGTVPGSGDPNLSGTTPLTMTGPPGASGMTGIGKGNFAQNPLDPALTGQLFQWLQSQIGKGASPFDLSTLLPSSGTSTTPGALNAPLTQLLQFMQGNFGPGGQIGQMAAGGVDAVAPWKTMVDAMQRQIGQGATNLKEQFNVGGGLVGSPYGSAAVDYQDQSNKDLNSLLAQMQFQGIQDQLQAGGEVQGAGQFMQGLDQQAIQNMLQEFIRTSPEYNPLLGMEFGASTTFPPVIKPQSGAGALGGLLGGAGSLLQSIPGLADMFGGAGGAAASTLPEWLGPLVAGFCWVAEVIYGKNDERTELVRKWLREKYSKTENGAKVISVYIKHGQAIAEAAKNSKELRDGLKPYFDKALELARLEYA